MPQQGALNIPLILAGASALRASQARPYNQGRPTFSGALGDAGLAYGTGLYQQQQLAQAKELKEAQIENSLYKTLMNVDRWNADRDLREYLGVSSEEGKNRRHDQDIDVKNRGLDIKEEDTASKINYREGSLQLASERNDIAWGALNVQEKNQLSLADYRQAKTDIEKDKLAQPGWSEPYVEDGQLVQRKLSGTDAGSRKVLKRDSLQGRKYNNKIKAARQLLEVQGIDWTKPQEAGTGFLDPQIGRALYDAQFELLPESDMTEEDEVDIDLTTDEETE